MDQQEYQKILLRELSNNNPYEPKLDENGITILDLPQDKESVILIDQFLFVFSFADLIDSQAPQKMQQIFDDFNNYQIDKFLAFKLKISKKINKHEFLNNLPDDAVGIFGDLIEVIGDFLKVLVRINAIYNQDKKDFVFSKVENLRENNMLTKLSEDSNRLNWSFIIKDINRPLRNADKHLRYVYDTQNKRIVGSSNGKTYFEIKILDFYKLLDRVMEIINCFTTAGAISKAVAQNSNNMKELSEIYFQKLTNSPDILQNVLEIYKPKLLSKILESIKIKNKIQNMPKKALGYWNPLFLFYM